MALYGLMAEFADGDQLVAAAQRVNAEGYHRVDAYSSFPVDGLAEALDFHQTRIPLVVLIGGIIGGIVGYSLQYYVAVIAYPVNVGGRPLNSWPLFIPVTFELIILFAALSAVIGMLVLNGFPMPYHPVFNVPRFSVVTRDGFFICIEAADPKFIYETTKQFLNSLSPREIYDVPE